MKKKSVNLDGSLNMVKLHKDLWEIFSRYIRLRDSYLDGEGFRVGTCFSCGKKYTLKKLQAGHFFRRTRWFIRYDERNVHSQCYRCNIVLSGNFEDYQVKMRGHYGQEVIDDLESKRELERLFTADELVSMIAEYKIKVKELGGWS